MSTKPSSLIWEDLTELRPGITYSTVKVLIAAGEKSGFILAEMLQGEIKRLNPRVEIRVFDISATVDSTLGFWEGAKKFSRLKKVLVAASRVIEEFCPDVFVPIAFPGVNIILSWMVRRKGVRVIYLAPPQFWAWGRFRVKILPHCADEFICLFAFEKEFFRRANLNAAYFGYPFLDSVVVRQSEAETRALLGFSPETKYIAFLPGSRINEIRFHQPLFINLFCRLRRRDPKLKGVIVGGEDAVFPDGMVRVGSEHRYETIRYARVAVVVSGTATAETALLGTPMVVTYHFDQPSRFFARMFVRVKFFSIPNLVLNRPVVPELFEPDEVRLNRIVLRLLKDEEYRTQMMVNLKRVQELLGPKGAMAQIARTVLDTGF